MSSLMRQPAVAGQFYPAHPERLRTEVEAYTADPDDVADQSKIPALGCVVPHAGYMYSGHVAGALYRRLQLPKHFIILCPNHTGMGEPLAIMSGGAWQTPLGEAVIDGKMAERLKLRMPLLSEDAVAHRNEHALEVQLPFLQVLAPGFCFVPIAVGTSNFDVLRALGIAVGQLAAESPEGTLIVASSDMNHYESDQVTRVKDAVAIQELLALNARGLYDVVHRNDISMCGYGPAIVMLTATQIMGASKAELIRYATSGDIAGERDRVVGYAGIAVS